MTVRPCVLVIDDEKDIRAIISENLSDCGYDVIEAENGEEALKLLDEGARPRVVITDIIMPGKEGLEVILELRKRYQDIRLIAISGGGQSENVDFLELAKKLGANATLPKPFDMMDLEAAVRKLSA